jgi:uncharacterized protein YjdB
MGVGCFTTTSVLVNPSLPITGTTINYVGLSTTLSNAVAGGLWRSSNTTIATVGSISGDVLGVATGNATISYTLPTGCLRTTTIIVNPAPPVITGATNVCVGHTVMLSNILAGTWSSGNTLIATIGATTGIVTGINAGFVTIYYTFASTGLRIAYPFTVNRETPVTGPGSVCTGQTINLSNSEAMGIWTSSATSIATVSSGSGLVTGIATGSATISYTLPTGCMSSANVNVYPLLPVTGPSNICVGQVGLLTDATPGGIWSSGNNLIATIGSSTGFVTGISGGFVNISYTVGSTGCRYIFPLTVNVLSPITGPFVVCEGQTTTLRDVSTGGTWSTSDLSTISVGSGSGVVTGVAAGTGVVTYTLFTGCITMATVTVNPLAPITGPAFVCVGQTVALTDATTGGTWSSTSPVIASIGSVSGLVTGNSPGFTNITYSVGGCRTATTITAVSLMSISGTGNVCIGQTTNFSYLTVGGVWSSSDNAIATVGSGSGVVSGISTGTAIISYSFGAGCTAVKTVTVNTVAPITGSSNVCLGSTTTLSCATTGGTWISSRINASVGFTTGVVTGVATGTAIISYTSPLGCETSFDVLVLTSPAAIVGSSSVCEGSTTTMSSATTGGVWSSGSTTIAIGSLSGVVTGVATGVADISYTIGTGCTVTNSITVNPLPASVSGSGDVCVGSTITLSNTTSGGTWLTSGGVASVNNTTGVVTGLSSGVATISYVLSTGCFTDASVVVNPLPATISGAGSVCEGFTTLLTNTTTGGTWSSSNANATIGTSSGLVTGIASGSAIITYTLPTGCFNTTTINVSSMAPAISGATAVCEGASISLSNPVSGGLWSASNTNVAVGVLSGVVTGVTSGTSTVTYTLGSGCYSLSAITVNPLPATISGSATVCLGSTTSLTNAMTGGLWTASNSNVSIGSSTGSVTGVALGTATITYTLPTGCSITSPILVNPLPAAIGGSASVCEGLNTTLSNATSGGRWSSSSTTAIVGSVSGMVTGIAAGTAVITYMLPTGCMTTTVMVVHPLPAAIAGASSVCVGSAATLTSATTGGLWETSSTNATVGSASGIVTGVAAGTATITYRLSTGCTTTTNILVNPLPAAIGGTLNVCEGATTKHHR